MAKKKQKETADQIRKSITNDIVESIKKGTPPWRKPWVGVNGGWPTNFLTKRRYTGVNPIILLSTTFSSKFWGTANQWAKLAGVSNGKRVEWGPHIKKGETSSSIVLFRPIPIKKDGVVQVDKNGKERFVPWMKRSAVFNAEQIAAPDVSVMVKHRSKDELFDHAKKLKLKPIKSWNKQKLSQAIHDEIRKRLDEYLIDNNDNREKSSSDYLPAEALMEATEARIRHGGSSAFYRMPPDDFIQLPKKESFNSISAYYEVALHELSHWAEDDSRAGTHDSYPHKRGTDKEGYAFRELVAELTSCFMMAELGVPLADQMIEGSKSYLNSWLSQMGGDHKYLFRASTQASKVADYLLSFVGMENSDFHSESAA